MYKPLVTNNAQDEFFKAMILPTLFQALDISGYLMSISNEISIPLSEEKLANIVPKNMW